MQFGLFAALLVAAFAAILLVRARTQRSSPEDTARARAEFSAWIFQNRIPIAFLFSGPLLALLGLGMFLHASVSSTVALDLASLERGEPSSGSFVRVSGQPSPDLAPSSSPRPGVHTYYTPLRSTPERPVALLVSSSRPIQKTGPFEGLLISDLPVGIPAQLEASGLRLAPTLYVLVPGETPEARRPIGIVLFAFGAVLGAIGAFFLRRSGRPAGATPP